MKVLSLLVALSFFCREVRASCPLQYEIWINSNWGWDYTVSCGTSGISSYSSTSGVACSLSSGILSCTNPASTLSHFVYVTCKEQIEVNVGSSASRAFGQLVFKSSEDGFTADLAGSVTSWAPLSSHSAIHLNPDFCDGGGNGEMLNVVRTNALLHFFLHCSIVRVLIAQNACRRC
jgi:hypothetical protein